MRAGASEARRVLVSGSTGLLGRAVVAAHRAMGDTVVPLLRGDASGEGVRWRAGGTLDPAAVSGFDAVVHLAGEPVASGRWTDAKKRRIHDSRVDGTRGLVAALRAADRPPGVLLCASGINCYGDCGEAVVDEGTTLGTGFLAGVCKEWEAAANALEPVARVVNLRIGVVLTPEGGALATMLPLFRMGFAGPIAGVKAYVSWVTLADGARVVGYAMASATLRGPVNVVSPEPVTGAVYTREIAAAVGRPAMIPVPAWAARLALGQMAEETVLTSIRAVPRRLREDGFVFSDPSLQRALAGWALRK